MSEEQADQEDHDNHGKEGGEGGEEAILGEQRTKVTDILSPAAMTNAYYICHNVQDLMFFRGFGWNGQSKGKGKGKKK